jgi:uncharacterized protein YcbX
MTVASIHISPVKGCKGIELREATFGPRSLHYDRHWIVVDGEGEKVTQREEPRLALIHTSVQDDTLTLSAEGYGFTQVNIRAIPTEAARVDVWGDDSPGLIETADASEWIGQFLGRNVTLLRFDESKRRDVVPEWGGDSGAHIAFNDCMPVLVTNTRSLDALNDWRAEDGLPPCRMDRFRPNIVVNAAEAWEEDAWPAVTDGNGIHLDFTRPCSRCQVTNTDQQTGQREAEGNLHVLGKRRNFKNYLGRPGVFFGVQALVNGCEGRTLRVGARLHVAEAAPGLPNVPRFL